MFNAPKKILYLDLNLLDLIIAQDLLINLKIYLFNGLYPWFHQLTYHNRDTHSQQLSLCCLI